MVFAIQPSCFTAGVVAVPVPPAECPRLLAVVNGYCHAGANLHDALDAFLEPCLNRAAVLGDYAANPVGWALAVRVRLPAGGWPRWGRS